MINKVKALDIVMNRILEHIETTKCKDDDIQTLTQLALVLEMDPGVITKQNEIHHRRMVEQDQKERAARQASASMPPSGSYGFPYAQVPVPPNSDHSSDYKW